MASVHWTFEEIKKNASNWNLEGDSQLLELMKSVSDNLLNRANITTASVNKMGITLEKSLIAFENASNKLSTLSKTQFVESRVYDDNEIKPKQDCVEKETKIYNPNETIKIILGNNLRVLENCYEKVSLNLDDSDEDDEQIRSTIIYRPKNLYTKSLPALIGSEQWNAKWHIGLIDSDDESVSEKGNAREEFSDDSAENISLPSIGPTISESGSSVWSVNRILPHHTRKFNDKFDPSSDEEALSSNTFLSKTSSENARKIKTGKMDQVNEQKYYIHKPKGKHLIESSDSGDENNKSKYKIQPSVTHHNLTLPQKKYEKLPKVSNIFSDEPPDLDYEEKSKKKFVDEVLGSDTEQNDLFSEVKPKFAEINRRISKENCSSQNDDLNTVAKKSENLFDDNDFDTFMREINEKVSNKTTNARVPKKVNLFNLDSEPELEKEDELHSNSQSISAKSLAANNSDHDNNESKNYNKIKRNLLLYPNDPRNLFDDFGDEVDLFLPARTEDNKISGSLSSALLSKTKISNLFDDEPPEDDFDNLFQTSRSKVGKIFEKKDIDININLEKHSLESPPKKTDENVYDVADSDESSNQNKIKSSRNTKANSLDKSITSTLFSSNWSDNDENLFSTKEAQNLSSDFESGDIDNQDSNAISTKQNETDDIVANTFAPQIPPVDFNIPSNEKEISKTLEKISYTSVDTSKEIKSKNKNQSNLYEDENIPDTNHDINFKNTPEHNFGSNRQINLCSTSSTNNYNADESASLDINDKGSKRFVDNTQTLQEDFHSEDMQHLFQSSNKNEQSSYDKQITQIKKNISIIVDNKQLTIENQNESDEILTQKLENESNENNLDKMRNEVYSSLFSNAPAPSRDEDLLNKNTTTVEESVRGLNAIERHSKSYGNNHIGLFDDIPPDDFIDDNKKHPENLFNEDFDNTVEVSFEKDIKSNYIISEEPPPDDYFKENLGNANYGSDVINPNTDVTIPRDTNMSSGLPNAKLKVENDSRFDKNQSNIIKSVTQSVSLVQNQMSELEKSFLFPEKVAQKLSKLKTVQHEIKNVDASKNSIESDSVSKIANELKINVSALLPGAKRPSKIKEDSSDNKISENSNYEEVNKVIQLGNPGNITKEGKLIGLNKSRPKILVKRRPSTRKARQESYRKSIVDNDSISDSEKDFESINKQAARLSESRNSKPINFTKNEKIGKNIEESIENFQSDFLNVEVKKEIRSSNMASKMDLKGNSPLFNDSDDDFKTSDWLSQLSSNKKILSYKEKSDVYIRSITDTSDNTLNDNSQKIIQNPKMKFIDDGIFNNIEPHINKPTSDFNNDCKQVPALNFDYKTSGSEPYYCDIAPTQDIGKKNSLTYSLENDDDDLFSSPFVKVVSSQTSNSVANKIGHKQQNDKHSYDTNNSEIFKKVSVIKSTSDIVETTKQNDILNIAIKEKSSSKSKCLFSSDDDDEDDLFGGSSSKRNSNDRNTKAKTVMLKQTKNIHEDKRKENLFDDIEDDGDEDLFGNKIVKAVSTSKIISKAQPNRGAIPKRFIEKKVTKIQDTNNPLADLFDQ